MKKKDFQVSVNAQRIEFTKPAIFKDGTWLVPLESFAKQLELAEWRKALALDPKNWIIHKQIWAVEHPDKFYDGDVDYGWQKTQLETEGSKP